MNGQLGRTERRWRIAFRASAVVFIISFLAVFGVLLIGSLELSVGFGTVSNEVAWPAVIAPGSLAIFSVGLLWYAHRRLVAIDRQAAEQDSERRERFRQAVERAMNRSRQAEPGQDGRHDDGGLER